MATFHAINRALRRGQKRARAGKLDEALEAFATPGDTADVRLLTQHALALARAGRSSAALDKIAQAAASAPKDPVPAIFRAYLLLRSGRSEEAAAELERARGLAPDNPVLATLSAVCDILEGHPAAGCRQLLEGPVTDNGEVIAWTLAVVEGRIHEAVGTDSGAVPPEPEKPDPKDAPPEALPELSADAAARRGRKLLEEGRPNAALPYVARATAQAPDEAEHHAMYGAALFETGHFEEAEAELARAPEDGPLVGVAGFYRAANAYRLGRHEAALELLDEVPLVGDAFFYREWCEYVRGMALVALGRTDEAAPYLATFIDAEPEVVERRLKKAIELLPEEEECCTSS
jgi:tetratricopeptide (TPR) repeat protein